MVDSILSSDYLLNLIKFPSIIFKTNKVVTVPWILIDHACISNFKKYPDAQSNCQLD